MMFFLKHLDYAHDIWSFYHRVMDLGQMTLELEREAGIVRLKISLVRFSLIAHFVCIFEQRCYHCIKKNFVKRIKLFVLILKNRINSVKFAFAVLPEI